ncbi:MAG: Fic family protein [Methylotenera sp.]|nr:Fic family protein [Methylotenera sp.]
MSYIFPDNPRQIEPLSFEASGALLEKSYILAIESAKLSASIHPMCIDAVASLVSNMNCYYSNLIEGHNTKPIDIERALSGDYSTSPEKRVLQLEARAHVEVEKSYLATVTTGHFVDIFSTALLCSIHREFYSKLPDDLHWSTSIDGKKTEKIAPGSLRTSEVEVGKHYPPLHTILPEFMQRFESGYQMAWQNKLPYQRLPLIASAHHRLLWIHPFLDGNGRVARLFSVLAMKAAGIEGIGLWSPARGLARNVDEYKSLLQDADSLRRGDLDGRGNLSLNALQVFSTFFVDTCIDQIRFMSEMFDLDNLSKRIEYFFGVLSTTTTIKKESHFLVMEALRKGEFARGEASKITGFGERISRDMLGELLKLGFLASDSAKGPIKIAFPTAATGYYFPNLFPAGSPTEINEYIAAKKLTASTTIHS